MRDAAIAVGLLLGIPAFVGLVLSWGAAALVAFVILVGIAWDAFDHWKRRRDARRRVELWRENGWL